MHPDERKLFRIVGFIALIFVVLTPIYFFTALSKPIEADGAMAFTVEPGDNAKELSDRLEEEGIVRSAGLFRRYLSYKGIDKKMQVGTFTVEPPITIRRVASTLLTDTREENEITILPGWNIRDIATYLAAQGYGTEAEVYTLLGRPAKNYGAAGFPTSVDTAASTLFADKPAAVSFEGYLAPETYRVFTDATIEDIVDKLITQRESQMTEKMYRDIEKSGRSFFEVLTVASIVEREVRGKEDKEMVADLFWRRYDENWALQADSTVHYIHGNPDSVFTSARQRDVDNPWNTYKYPGLPLGPISMPSIETIKATIYPKKNSYAYFLTDAEGTVYYARTLDEHNANRARYIQ